MSQIRSVRGLTVRTDRFGSSCGRLPEVVGGEHLDAGGRRQGLEQGKVIYLAEKRSCRRFPRPASPDLFNGVARNFQVFDPLDFIAEVTQHVPDPRRHLVRYFGFYSNKSRGRRAKAKGDPPHDAQAPRSPSASSTTC